MSKKPSGYWQDLENVRLELAPFVDSDGVLAETDFITKQNRSLMFAISRYHGGLWEVRRAMGLTKKRCAVCGEVKDIETGFRQTRRGEENRAMNRPAACKQCTYDRVSTYRDTALGRAANIVRLAKARAKREGWPFNLTREWVLARLEAINWCCEVTGIPFEKTGASFFESWTSVSVDQIEPAKGYTMDNVQFVLAWVNKAKSNLPMEQFRAFCEAVMKGGINQDGKAT